MNILKTIREFPLQKQKIEQILKDYDFNLPSESESSNKSISSYKFNDFVLAATLIGTNFSHKENKEIMKSFVDIVKKNNFEEEFFQSLFLCFILKILKEKNNYNKTPKNYHKNYLYGFQKPILFNTQKDRLEYEDFIFKNINLERKINQNVVVTYFAEETTSYFFHKTFAKSLYKEQIMSQPTILQSLIFFDEVQREAVILALDEIFWDKLTRNYDIEKNRDNGKNLASTFFEQKNYVCFLKTVEMGANPYLDKNFEINESSLKEIETNTALIRTFWDKNRERLLKYKQKAEALAEADLLRNEKKVINNPLKIVKL